MNKAIKVLIIEKSKASVNYTVAQMEKNGFIVTYEKGETDENFNC